MENLIDKIQTIVSMSKILDDSDKDKYDEIVLTKLKQMEQILDDILEKMNFLNYSEEKWKTFKIEMDKERNLLKQLFPVYWILENTIKFSKFIPQQRF